MLRLLRYDYRRTARYYTIYRTFKSLSSDDFTTIPRLFYWRNYDYWPRLFQNLLRLFQPGRYDYCSSLLAIGRKPEKRYGGSRQWFRAARRWTAPPGVGCRAVPVQVDALTPQQVRRVCAAGSVSALASNPQAAGADPAGLAWSAMCCTVWHGSITGARPCTLIYLIIIGRLC